MSNTTTETRWYLMSLNDDGIWNEVMSFWGSVARSATFTAPVDGFCRVLVVTFTGARNSDPFRVEFGQNYTITPDGLVR